MIKAIFSELDSDNFKTLYKLSSCGEIWYPEELLQLWEEKNVKEIQNDCILCQKYGKSIIFNDKYCLGFIDFSEDINCLPILNKDRTCYNCEVFIGNE